MDIDLKSAAIPTNTSQEKFTQVPKNRVNSLDFFFSMDP